MNIEVKFLCHMRLLSLLLIVIAFSANAEECVFAETAYTSFIKSFIAKNKNSKIEADGKTLVVNRNNEEILVKGGGCVHLGVAIELTTKQKYSEEQFLNKTLELASEFGGWLINVKALKNSINNEKYQKINDIYFINVDAMTVFESSYDKQGKINVDFYIN